MFMVTCIRTFAKLPWGMLELLVETAGHSPLDLVGGVYDHALPQVRRCDHGMVVKVHECAAGAGSAVSNRLQQVVDCGAWELSKPLAYHSVGVRIRAAELWKVQDSLV